MAAKLKTPVPPQLVVQSITSKHINFACSAPLHLNNLMMQT